jgi:hypothetical protein
LILPSLKKAMSTLTFHSNAPLIAKGYLRGQEICTYSICHSGRITAHTAYPSTFTAGQGATIVFQHIDHPAIFQWVKTFVARNHFTGQIAFDFMQTPDGQIFALECNPRATSGAHLLASHPRFVDAFINPPTDCITPIDDSSYMLSTAMLVALGENGVKTVEDLADCATDDLSGWNERKDKEKETTHHDGMLEKFGLTKPQIEELILAARVKAGWITEADLAPEPEEAEGEDAEVETEAAGTASGAGAAS